MSNRRFCTLISGLLLVTAGSAAAQTSPVATKPPVPSTARPAAPEPAAAPAAAHNDYARPENWLCLPGQKGACDVDQDTTVAAADGSLKVEKFTPAKAPAIDCFYVYPTVSNEPGFVASMTVAPEELRVVALQFARFGQVCRQFAPVYRQVTLAALRAQTSGTPIPPGVDLRVNYSDVVDAWNYYLAHHNAGRGVVLIGHSQGTRMLTQLIKNEIDGKPVQRKLVSAILMGGRVQVAAGKAVGGDFASVPLCKSSHETGCAIAYASFRASAPPDPTSRFGKGDGPGLEAACVNPAALAGGSGEAHAYLSTGGAIVNVSAQVEWVKGKKITTPFISLPGMLTAECKKNEVASYLAITVHGDAAGQRTADIPGDIVINGNVLRDWGLHLIDVNLFMGNLVGIVRDQAAAYAHQKH